MSRSRRENRGLFAGLTAFVLACAASGCAGTGDGDPDGLGGETHYTLKRGTATQHPKPLPTEWPILVDHFQNGGEKVTTEGFRGWDFNGDGRFEMVDVLNADGSLQARLFDFDEDGRVDARREPGSK